MARSRKATAIVTTLIGSALVLLSWSQAWFALSLAAGSGTGRTIDVGGATASPALAALALAGLALAGALGLAGPGLRMVLGVLEAVLGGCVILAGWMTLADPVGAVAPAVTHATGVAGRDPIAGLVAHASATLWPVVALVGGAILLFAGVLVILTGRSWPNSSRKYAVELAAADRGAERPSDRAVADWDELSRGDDPTEPPAASERDRTDPLD